MENNTVNKTKQYIMIRDDKNNSNIWSIFDETDGLYWICTRDCNTVIDKEAVEQPVKGSSLFTYKGIVNVENVICSYISCKRCIDCLYFSMCADACKVEKCGWELDCEDDRLDGEIDRVVLDNIYDY